MASADVWHLSDQDEDDEYDARRSEEMMLTPFHENDRTQLLNYTVEHRNPRQNVAHSSAYHHARDEKKYKYSLVSILVVGVVLLMMINIGLGLRKCDTDTALASSHAKTTVKPSVCRDRKTGVVFPWQSYRLPTWIVPELYHIFLHPNFTTKACQGDVTINLQVRQKTSIIVLHVGPDVKLGQVKLAALHGLGHTVAPNQILHCLKNEVVAFQFSKPLVAGKAYQITIHFSYKFTNSLFGFYLSHYTKPDGSQMVIGTTQMEPLYARRAFPCFDEPSFKANFSLSMVREKIYFTLFNMPRKSTKAYGNNGLEIDEFETSVRMSSYLVAFLVSDFESISKKSKDGITVTMYSSPGKTKELGFALDIALQSLEFYANLFKIPFPLPKMDIVGIPDFEAGAMENWGLLMFRESALLYNPNTSTVSNKQWIATTVAHEISHQWFGNLVTMKWWDDLWLNEGFATYMQYYAVAKLHKEWKLMNEFPLRVLFRAMAVDVSHYTHPIKSEVNNAPQIQAMFDSISYEKGGSLITMLADYFGENFFVGLRAYLHKFAYDNAVSNDLIRAVTEAANDPNVDVNEMMRTWTTQPGFPMLHVSQTKDKKIHLRQERFLYKSEDPTNVPAGDTVWQIPLLYVTDKNSTSSRQYFMKTRTASIDASFKSWIKFNHLEGGYYVVTYDQKLWRALSKQLRQDPSVFTTKDRMSILHHAFVSARAGYLSYADLFPMIEFVKKETEYITVTSALSGLGYMSSILRYQFDQSTYKMLQRFSSYLLKPIYDRVAWKDQSILDYDGDKLQSAVTAVMCNNGYQPCIDEALRVFDEWRYNHTAIPPDLQVAVLKTAVTHGPVGSWDYIWNYYLNTTDAVMKIRLVSVLATTTNVDKLLFLQQQALAGVTIRSQNLNYALGPMFSTMVGSTLTWKLMREKWSELTAITPVSGFTMRSLIKGAVVALTNKDDIIIATNFYKAKGVANSKFVGQALESAWIRLYWTQHRLPQVKAWLSANQDHYSSL